MIHLWPAAGKPGLSRNSGPPGWGLPRVYGLPWDSRGPYSYLCVFSSSFVLRLAYAASLRAQLQGVHVHGHVVPRARRMEAIRQGQGWLATGCCYESE